MSEIYDRELEEIKKRKMLELQQRLLEEQRRKEEEALREAKKQEFLRRILTPEARDRLNNIKIVRPEIASFVEDQLIALAQAGRLPIPVSEDIIKKILEQIYSQTHREIRVRIKGRIVSE